MKIINPIYDHAFKYLMQNERIAKKVLGTLLECEVLELTLEQQEVIAVDEVREIKLYRLDFSALIIDETGEFISSFVYGYKEKEIKPFITCQT